MQINGVSARKVEERWLIVSDLSGKVAGGILSRILVFGLVIAFASEASGQEDEPRVEPMTLTQVIALVLRNNHDISVQDLNRVIEAERVKMAKAAFDPRFEASYAYQDIDTPQNAQEFVATGGGAANTPFADTQTGLATPILTTPTIFEQRNHVSELALIQRLTNGATLELGSSQRILDNTLNRNRPPGIFNSEYETYTGVTLTQPLLKDSGREVNLTEMRIAQSNTRLADLEWRSRTAGSVANAMKLYFDVIFAYENMRIQKDAIELAETLYAGNKKRHEEGVLSPIEVLVAEGAVYTRKEDALIAETQYVERQNALQLLFRSGDGSARPLRIVPADRLKGGFEVASRSTLLCAANSSRYDILQALELVDQRDRQAKFAKNQIKPRLDLIASIGSHGLDGDLGRSYGAAANGQGPEWTLGVTFSVPLGAKQAKAEARLAELQAKQAEIQADRVRLQIALELDTVLNRIKTDRQRVITGGKSREIAGEAMTGEVKRLDEGVSTTYQVLQYQHEYSRARSRELAALADLNKDELDLWLITGRLLENKGIVIDNDSSIEVNQELESIGKWRHKNIVRAVPVEQ
tara:strand:- start:290 stop:2032 length:1743 start_codon:yes stop_codon:yes gene_type:complete